MSRRQPYELNKPLLEDAAPMFWRSLEEKANPASFDKRKETEFPDGQIPKPSEIANNPDDTTSIGRRGFMMFAGMTAALAAEGCARRPVEKIMPYTRAPEYSVPGLSYHYATVRHHRGEAIGLLVESHEGRPTKIEGNPDHPASAGATDLLTQAAIFDLYDPDRSTSPRNKGQAASFAEFDKALNDLLVAHGKDGGMKLRVLTQPSNSPTFVRTREAVRAKWPHAVLHTYAPVNEANMRDGAVIAFGQAVRTVNDYANAKIILALDSDFLQTEPGAIRATRAFASGRRMRTPNDSR